MRGPQFLYCKVTKQDEYVQIENEKIITGKPDTKNVFTHTRSGSAGIPDNFWITSKGEIPDKAPVSVNDFKAA
jgi:vancomycin resistance protein YoaR